MVLMSLKGVRPGFSWVCGCTERRPPASDDELLPSRLKQND